MWANHIQGYQENDKQILDLKWNVNRDRFCEKCGKKMNCNSDGWCSNLYISIVRYYYDDEVTSGDKWMKWKIYRQHLQVWEEEEEDCKEVHSNRVSYQVSSSFLHTHHYMWTYMHCVCWLESSSVTTWNSFSLYSLSDHIVNTFSVFVIQCQWNVMNYSTEILNFPLSVFCEIDIILNCHLISIILSNLKILVKVNVLWFLCFQ